jgi:hypothetical protein
MTLFLIIGAVMLGTITGTLTARRGDLLSLAISLAALLMLVLLAQLAVAYEADGKRMSQVEVCLSSSRIACVIE